MDFKSLSQFFCNEEGHLVFVSNKDTFTLEGSVTAETEIFAIGYDGNYTKVEF